MKRVVNFIYPGIRLKRWIFLFVLSFIVFTIGFSGILGKILGGFNFDVLKLDKVFIPVRDAIRSSTKLVTIDIIAIILGLLLLYYIIYTFLRSVRALYPKKIDIVKASYDEIQLRNGPKIVTIGGGTGLSSLLKGLKLYTSNITAVVTVADDGGSSGRLRKDMKILPPGDIRNCMVALADSSALLSKVFQYRFKTKEKNLNGHSFGNLFIGAMSSISGSFEKAIQQSAEILSIRGKVIPVTLEKITMHARLKNKKKITGQSNITHSRYPIDRVFINPASPIPSGSALAAIKRAKLIVLGPGSLFTSVMPNLLIKEITNEIMYSTAKKIYICNIMTQPGETSRYTASEHLKAIAAHTGYNIIEYIIVNTGEIPRDLIKKYRLKGSQPVKIDLDNLAEMGVAVIEENLVSIENGFVRHNSEKLAEVILKTNL